MIAAQQALEKIFETLSILPAEKISLHQALGRYLAKDVFAPLSLPPFSSSAMDGFALRSEETLAASSQTPLSFEVVGTVAAGALPVFDFMTKPPAKNKAVRIMTGAAVPAWADAIVLFEMGEVQKGSHGEEHVVITEALKPGRHVRKIGEDILEGTLALSQGNLVTSRAIALLSSLGLQDVWVGVKPKVRVIATGDELAKPGMKLQEGQIYNSNGPSIVAALQEIGITPTEVLWVRDTEEELESYLKANRDVDITLSIGGVSAGDYDFVPKVLRHLGAEILFHKIAIKPGKPFLFARWGSQLLFGLPGNPVSSWITFDRFVRPALLKMMGARECQRPRRVAKMEEICTGSPGKEDYIRAKLRYHDGDYLACSAGPQSSSRLKTLSDANGIIIIPENQSQVEVGRSVEVELWEEI